MGHTTMAPPAAKVVPWGVPLKPTTADRRGDHHSHQMAAFVLPVPDRDGELWTAITACPFPAGGDCSLAVNAIPRVG
jgi:hypothetical protein